MLKRGWKIILITTLIAVVISLLVSYLVTPQYRAIARFIITPSSADVTQPDTVLQGLQTLDNQSVIATYVEVMNSDRIYNDALDFLQLKPQDVLDYSHKSEIVSSSNVLQLTVIGPDPALTTKIANSIGNQTINFLKSNNQVISVSFLDTATLPTEPYSPQPLINALLALVLGLIGGALIVILREQLLLTLEVFRQSLHIDSDTGVYNKKYFLRLLEEELVEHPKVPLSVGIVKLVLSGQEDDLSEVYPTAVIQKVLRQTTDLLRNELRGNDHICRWDDTSFSILLPNTNGMATSRIFERIHQSLKGSVDLGQFGMTIDLDSFIGAAQNDDSISTSQDLIDEVNRALELAHRDKSEPVYVWEAQSNEQVKKTENS